MRAQKDPKTGKWLVQYRYTDWQGKRRKSTKRGFLSKKDAETWLCGFLLKAQADFHMKFSDFLQIYYEDMDLRLREYTMKIKRNIIDSKILPYFGEKKMSDITVADIRQWQSILIKKGYSQTYLKTIHNQMNAIMNFAVKYYELKDNPVEKAGSIGLSNAEEMKFWVLDEYMKFSEAVMDKPISFYAFEVLYWTGIREGELLALTPADFDFEKYTMTINKSFQHLNGRDLITTPKTEKSNRVIRIPKFLAEEIQEYLKSLYNVQPQDRMFPITKSYLYREMQRGSKESGVKRIRIHDIRHSHVSHLIDLGFSPTAIADRVGHESIDITLNYAHLFPSKQAEMADKLDLERGY